MTDATSALLSAIRREFSGTIVTIEKIRSDGWVNGLYAGAHHEVVVRLDGKGAAEKADAFAATPDLSLSGHLIAELDVLEHEAIRGRIHYARLALRVNTIEDHREPRAIAEPDPNPAGALATFENRRSEPWMLVGYLSGTVVITNGVVNPPALKLYRFRTEAQARAGAEVLIGHARLEIDGSWFLPDVRAETDADEKRRAMLIWAAIIDQQLGWRLRGLGPGHYSIAHRALGRAAEPA